MLKSGFLAFVLFLASSSAHAHVWATQAYISVNPTYITAQVVNDFGAPVQCQGRVFGTRVDGFRLWSNFYVNFLPAGGFTYSYVYTSYPFYFVDGWAEVYCSYYY